MIDFNTLRSLTIREGVVTKITDENGKVLWDAKVFMDVVKLSTKTFNGETICDDNFILLDIYPETNGTVKITYGGLTKIITDTSGAAEPEAQQVYFGKLYGISDSVGTPEFGELTIEGDCRGFGVGSFYDQDDQTQYYNGISEVKSWGHVRILPSRAFRGCADLTVITIPETVTTIGYRAFENCSGLELLTIPASVASIGMTTFMQCTALVEIKVLATTPPSANGMTFSVAHNDSASLECKITVPKGCSEAYKAASGWSKVADYIVEAEE